MHPAEDVAEGVRDAIRKAFADPNLIVTRRTEASDVDGWDSLSHATLMIMIARKFRIDITQDESNALVNVGDLIDLVQSKLSA
jgi:acyl carrier protein